MDKEKPVVRGPGPRIELVYDGSSVYVEASRDAVRSALCELGLLLDSHEWDRQQSGGRDPARYFGPANVLIDGEPVVETNQTPGVWNDGRGQLLVRAAILKLRQS